MLYIQWNEQTNETQVEYLKHSKLEMSSMLF